MCMCMCEIISNKTLRTKLRLTEGRQQPNISIYDNELCEHPMITCRQTNTSLLVCRCLPQSRCCCCCCRREALLRQWRKTPPASESRFSINICEETRCPARPLETPYVDAATLSVDLALRRSSIDESMGIRDLVNPWGLPAGRLPAEMFQCANDWRCWTGHSLSLSKASPVLLPVLIIGTGHEKSPGSDRRFQYDFFDSETLERLCRQRMLPVWHCWLMPTLAVRSVIWQHDLRSSAAVGSSCCDRSNRRSVSATIERRLNSLRSSKSFSRWPTQELRHSDRDIFIDPFLGRRISLPLLICSLSDKTESKAVCCSEVKRIGGCWAIGSTNCCFDGLLLHFCCTATFCDENTAEPEVRTTSIAQTGFTCDLSLLEMRRGSEDWRRLR